MSTIVAFTGKKCTEMVELLANYVDGELEDEHWPVLQEHLSHCDECSKKLKYEMKSVELIEAASHHALERRVFSRDSLPNLFRWTFFSSGWAAATLIWLFWPTVHSEELLQREAKVSVVEALPNISMVAVEEMGAYPAAMDAQSHEYVLMELQWGDNLHDIAASLGCTAQELQSWNPESRLRAGEVIRIPLAEFYRVPKGSTPTVLSRRFLVRQEVIFRLADVQNPRDLRAGALLSLKELKAQQEQELSASTVG